MKKLVIVLAALLAALVTVIACGAPPRPLAAARDAGAHRFGVTLNDSGLPVDEAGAVSIVLDGGGVPSILGDPAIDHCTLNQVSIDPPTCNFAAYINCGPRSKLVQGQLTQPQCSAVYNLVRAAAAAGGIQ